MSKIEWTDMTLNIVTGCTPVSAGCNNCYARKMATRLAGRYGYPADNPFMPGVVHEDKFSPASIPRKPCRIFLSSMGDLMHEAVSDEIILRILEMTRQHSRHTFQILTKRAERVREFHYPENVWVGVTAENQEMANKRLPHLLACDAVVRFVSVEPMLSPVLIDPEVSWVICGGETGPNARPMQVAWAELLRNECAGIGIPFFFKKTGGPGSENTLGGKLHHEFPPDGVR